MELGLDGAPATKRAPPKDKSGERETKGEERETKGETKGLDVGDDDEILKLVSEEGEKVPVSKKVGLMSELVKTMVEGGAFLFA